MSVIHVIGLGVGDKAELLLSAQQALNESTLVIGSKRQLASIEHLLGEQQIAVLPKLSELNQLIESSDATVIAVLASGDPLFYGIGKWLLTHCRGSVHCHPGISSIQYACHHLGISLQDVEVISLHGRPISYFRQRVRNFSAYMFLTDATNTPAMIAEEAKKACFDDSEIWVFERLGYADERIRYFPVHALSDQLIDIDDLNICYLKTAGKGQVYPEFPGLPDERFITGKGTSSQMITKREVRLTILSLLQSQAHEVAWDVGAGCGSVAIEWGLWSRNTAVYAVEQQADRYAAILQNKVHFGVGNLQVINAHAPEALKNLPAPDAVFIGGSDGDLMNLMTYCWQRLKSGGRLVVSAVTENARMAMHQFLQTQPSVDSEMLEIAVRKSTQLGRHKVLKPALPVTLLKIIK